MTIVALDHRGAKVETTFSAQIQLLDGAAAELANLKGLLQFIHNITAGLLGGQDRFTDLLSLGNAAHVQNVGDFFLVHAPCGKADTHLVKHAHLTGDLLTGMVGGGIDDDLITIEAAHAHGLGGMIIERVNGGVQFGNSATVAIGIHELDALGRILVGQDRHQHGGEGVKTAHLAGIEVLQLLALGGKCLLECAVGKHGIGAKAGHIGIEHCHGRAQARHHDGVCVISHLTDIQQIQLDLLTVILQTLDHIQALLQGTAAACAQQGRAIQNLNNVLFVQLSHFENLLFLFLIM